MKGGTSKVGNLRGTNAKRQQTTRREMKHQRTTADIQNCKSNWHVLTSKWINWKFCSTKITHEKVDSTSQMVLSPFCIQWWCLTHIPLRGGDSNHWSTSVCSAHSTLHSTSGPKLFGCKATRKFPLQSSPKENMVSPLNSCNSLELL